MASVAAMYAVSVSLAAVSPAAAQNLPLIRDTEIENLLDRRNTINVYSNTGAPDDDGYRQESLSGASPNFARLRRLLSLDPQHFSPPRETRFGVEVTF